MTDVIVAMIVLTLFVGIISTMYYQIAYANSQIRMNAIAVHYAVKIAEATDKMKYEEVDETLNATLNETYELPENFNATIQVKKYNEDDETKQDIIKIVTIKIDYEFMDTAKSYQLKKLKIKE